jgi:homoserine O-acetyltransferase
MNAFIFFWSGVFVSLFGYTQTTYPPAVESDYVIKNFKFESNESLPQLNIHYTTIGKPIKDKNGNIVNAVLIMHGTTGWGNVFLSDLFAGNFGFK